MEIVIFGYFFNEKVIYFYFLCGGNNEDISKPKAGHEKLIERGSRRAEIAIRSNPSVREGEGGEGGGAKT